jgi:K+-sensing histidine kinase KdpD
VMSHGGRVWVGEGESGGALFQISLPSGNERPAPSE